MKYLQRILPIALTALCGTVGVEAVRSNPRPSQVQLPDGSELAVRLQGDERYHYHTTSDGYVIEKATDGFFYYMQPVSGRLVRSSVRATGSRDAAEAAFVRSIDREAMVSVIDGQTRRSPRRSGALPSTFPTKGEIRGAVILVEYTDVSFTVPDAHNEFSRMLNEKGYSNYGGTGSARDWFVDNSMGEFQPTFDVYGPVRLPHPRAYYGENKSSGGDDARAHEMVIHACDILDDEVDFSQYDVDHDGWIDNVFVFFAGYGENLGYGVPEECVWPHSWDLTEYTNEPFMYDGVRLNHYACTNEIDLQDRMDGIGTFVHEFSHVLGLPDLYSTNYSNAFTPGDWCVMDAGPYNNDSRTPPNYSAYERYALGWLEPREIGAPANIKLDNISANTAARISTSNPDEYFLFENRQQTGWDKYIPGHGMLVWHIDYKPNVWSYNTVNNTKSHQYVDIEEADGLQSSSNRDGDSFPGAANVTEFTDDTTPSMRSWDDEPQNKPITDIRESNGYIYFKVSGGKNEVPAVAANEAEEVGIDHFTASWGEGNAGCQYILSVYTTEMSESGKLTTTFVPGWDSRNVGAERRAVVTDLDYATEYKYSVRVLDPETGLQSASSNEVSVTTLDATFDYLRPELSPAEKSGDKDYRISWSAVEGADEYMLSVYTKSYTSPESETADFTGGVSALAGGWQTNSNLTYANAAYCGEAVPSLRFNTGGQYLSTPYYDEGVRSLSFWARGVSAADDARIEVWGKGSGDWTFIKDFTVENAAGGKSCYMEEDYTWPENCCALRISFNNGGKGSLALDDVCVSYGGDLAKTYFGGSEVLWQGAETSMLLTGLAPMTTYWLNVTARQGDLLSKPSREVRLHTDDMGGVSDTLLDGYSFRVSGGSVNVTAADSIISSLYSMQGLLVGTVRGSGAIRTASPGIYLLNAGGKNWKLIIK